MLKIIDPANEVKTDLNEITQIVDMKFSFARLGENETVQRIHNWIKCRDFFGDVLVGHATKKVQKIYGFSYGPEDIPIDDENFTLLIKFPDQSRLDNFKNNWPILEQLCTNNNAQRPILEDTEDPVIKVLISDKAWQQNIPRISYYTFILKVMGYAFMNPMNWVKELQEYTAFSTEKKYISEIHPKAVNWLYEDCLFVFPNTDIHGHKPGAELVTIHNYSGFYTFCIPTCYHQNNKHYRDYTNYEKRKAAQLEELTNRAATVPAADTSSVGKPKRVAKAINSNTKANLKKRQQALFTAAVPA